MATNQTTIVSDTVNGPGGLRDDQEKNLNKDPSKNGFDVFDENLIKKYPRSNRKITVEVQAYSLITDSGGECKSQTSYISPYGMEFQLSKDYTPGTLLKILVSLPDYWSRKQRLVDYNRIDTPHSFRVLAKVVKTEDIGKRGKKKIVLVQTVNMDEVDELVLKNYLQDG